jgi:hypothetical protein
MQGVERVGEIFLRTVDEAPTMKSVLAIRSESEVAPVPSGCLHDLQESPA